MSIITPNDPMHRQYSQEITSKKNPKKEEIALEELALKVNQKDIPARQAKIAPPDQMTDEREKQILSKTKEMVQEVQHVSKRMIKNKDLKPEPKFICDQETYEQLLPKFQEIMVNNNADFNTQAFLAGPKGSSSGISTSNQIILDESVTFLREQAQKLVKEKSVSLEDAYKLLIGVLDNYDNTSSSHHRQDPSFKPQSTFVLRSAILLASQKDGIAVPSWMAYTKSGKPDTIIDGKIDNTNLWTFLDNWDNWVPETQGAIAKFSETTFIKAKELMRKNPDNLLILLKGGFGAGKTRLAGQLMKKKVSGVIAPDQGKWVVRRAMKEIPHPIAHIQGSQVAYKLFDDMIREQVGTVVYDSSLSLASDVKDYLSKSKKAEKKMVIYDVARHDMARSLAVLKRDIGGDDPRIPPDFIIRFAITDKLNRVECMKVVLEDEVTNENAAFAPEYRFIGADARGWNAEEVLILTPKSIVEKHPEMKKRLALEGIEVDVANNTVNLTLNEEQLKNYFAKQFERPAQDIMRELSPEENKVFFNTFSHRVLISDPQVLIHNETEFYNALPQEIKDLLPETAFKNAFAAIQPETRDHFFKSLQTAHQLPAKIKKTELNLAVLKDKRDHTQKSKAGRAKKANLNTLIDAKETELKNLNRQYKEDFPVSYLNLPLKTALIIHQSLKGDPWS